jgi:DNA helicase HerA-like ATPase
VTEKAVSVIGSPNTTLDFTGDILEGSIDSPLEGKLFFFWHDEGGKRKLVLAQMRQIQGRNRWHEDEVLKSVIKRQGRLEHLSGVTDVKDATLSLLGVFEPHGENSFFTRSSLNTPPLSGTSVYEVTEDLIRKIVQNEQGIFYLGEIFGSNTPAPFYLKHFGPEPAGFGEAHMMGVFGKAGSGKSIIAAEIIAGLARHQEMGILIVDPQGEFYDNRFGMESGFRFDFHEILRRARKTDGQPGQFDRKDLSDVALSGHRTFVRLLWRSGFFELFGIISEEKQEQAADALEAWFEDEEKSPHQVTPKIYSDEIIPSVIDSVGIIYAGTDKIREQRKKDARDRYEKSKKRADKIWTFVQEMFNPEAKTPLDKVLDTFLTAKRVIILDVAKVADRFQQVSAYEIKYILLYEIFQRMLYRVRARFREGERTNCLVVLDEAHHYVPQDVGKSPDRIRLLKQIEDATRTTRKYGIGWMFITQSIADFSKEVYRQIHDHVFAWGLGIGADETHVSQVVGKELFDLYRTLPNPKQSAIYGFMVAGGIVALGTRGTPLVIRGFATMDQLLQVNRL